MKNLSKKNLFIALGAFLVIAALYSGCNQTKSTMSGNEAEQVYVAPGTYDEFYMFASGGFS